MAARISGIASAFIDGVAVPAKGNCSYKPNNTKRESVVAMDGTFVGYHEEGDPAMIQFDMLNTGIVPVGLYFANTDALIVVVLANGMTVTGHGMTMLDPPEIKNDDATYTMKWVGQSVTEAPSV